MALLYHTLREFSIFSALFHAFFLITHFFLFSKDSLCTSGLSLPSSTGTSSYTTLVQNYVGREDYNSDLPILISSLGFTRSGSCGYNDGGLYDQSSYGGFRSRTPTGKASAYRLRFYSASLNPRISNDRGIGYTLRCLAR